MFKLGEYHEEKARIIADYLKDARMKVDIRTFSGSRMEVYDYLEGRMSELKSKLKDFERYELYIKTLRDVLVKGATPEDFREKFQLELDPQVKEKRKQLREIFEGDLPEEELEIKRQNFVQMMKDLTEMANAESFIDRVLDRNGIQIGADVGDRLDDPILRIFADPEDYDEEDRLFKTTTILTIEPRAEIYIDEFSSILSDEIDEKFEEEYYEEYLRIVLLGKLIDDLMEPSSSGKTDMKSFSERCDFQIEDDGNILVVKGRTAAESLARTLEKNGIIKVKGESIKWKR